MLIINYVVASNLRFQNTTKFAAMPLPAERENLKVTTN